MTATTKLQVTPTAIHNVLIIEPKVFGDGRGWFTESFNAGDFSAATGLDIEFVQDNHSFSRQWTLRGLHYQLENIQGKLVRVVAGSVFDVVVDIRKGSSTFGQWIGETLTADNKKQLWIPVGFAHGFAVLSENAELLYKTTDYWAPKHEHCIRWDDPEIGIQWPIDVRPQLSIKDGQGLTLNQAETFSE